MFLPAKVCTNKSNISLIASLLLLEYISRLFSLIFQLHVSNDESIIVTKQRLLFLLGISVGNHFGVWVVLQSHIIDITNNTYRNRTIPNITTTQLPLTLLPTTLNATTVGGSDNHSFPMVTASPVDLQDPFDLGIGKGFF